MKKVEQIIRNSVIEDYDTKLKPSQITSILKEHFGNVTRKNSEYEIIINNKKIILLVKNITYLGHPHPIFKKRIQLSNGWEEKLKNENTFIFGIYNYKSTRIFTYFDKNQYVKRKLNNSSAHISTFDLLKCQEEGVFSKKDNQNNIIISLKENELNEFIKKLIGKENILSKEINLFENFKISLDKKIKGINCYKEMFSSNYNNKNQAEWSGFFLEYKFEKYLDNNPELKIICNFQSNKKKNKIDLDLNFNNKYLGDLKAHSNSSSGILGNDKSNIDYAIKKYGKVWYIVFNHATKKDSDYKFITTIFWNKLLNKDDLMSYSRKMKYQIDFTSINILELNTYNKKYLSIFNQGINSNGNARKAKYKISKRSINNFLIYNSNF